MGEMTTFPWPTSSSGEFAKLPLDKIEVKNRVQGLDPKLRDELAASIERDGLQVPIVVRSLPEVGAGYELVSGLHRLEAYKILWEHQKANGGEGRIAYNQIPVIMLSKDTTVDEGRLWELVENVRRKNLDSKERASLGALIVELEARLWKEKPKKGATPVSQNLTNSPVSQNLTNSPPKPKGGPKADPWFKHWHEVSDLTKQSAFNYWSRFKAETEQPDVPPGKADEAMQKAFLEWVKAEPEKAAEAVEESRRKSEAEAAEKAKSARRDAFLIAARAVLEQDGVALVVSLLNEMASDHLFIVKPT